MDRPQRNGPPAVLHITHVDPVRDSETNADARALNDGPVRGDRGDVGPGPFGLRAGRPDQPPGARRGRRARAKSGLSRPRSPARNRSPSRFRSRRWIRLRPTRPPRERCCNRSATASPTAFVRFRTRPATRSGFCSERLSPSPMSPSTRQPKREPDGITNQSFRRPRTS